MSEEDLDDDSVITLEDIDKLIKTKQKSNKPGDDPQVRLSLEILKKIGKIHHRPEMLSAFAQNADSLQKEEEAALIDHLKALGIDWTMGIQPFNPQVSLEITTDHPENSVIAGDEYIIHATATNHGTAPVYRIAGRSESSFGRANDKEFIFGKIDPGKSVTRDYKVKTNRALASRVDNFKLKLYADDGSPVPEKVITEKELFLTVQELPQPDFTIHYAIIDDHPEKQIPGNGLLDDDETVTMRVWISNRGTGTAEKPLVYLKNKAPEIKLIDARSETEPLPKDQILSRDFTFKTSKVGQDDITMELHVYDKTSTHMLLEQIAFKTSKNAKISDSNATALSEKMIVSKDTKLFVSPIEKANSLTTIPENTIVQTDATLGNYTHITAGPVVGWVESTSLAHTTETTVSSLDVETIATIPKITIHPMQHITNSDYITIEADIDSWADPRDYYIYTASEVDHTYQFEKVAYSPLKKEDHSISAKVPLQKGMNTIRLYVRDQNKSEAHETVLVYRR